MTVFRAPGLSLVLGLGLSAGPLLAQTEPRLVSVANVPSATGSGVSGAATWSDDGRFVFFLSSARDLTPTDPGSGGLKLFRRELATRTTQEAVGGEKVNVIDYQASADGQRVVFVTATDRLVAIDTNQVADVFLRDLATGTTRLVSRSLSGTRADGPSRAPTISTDGRLVVFGSQAQNLTVGDVNRVEDVFRWDATTELTECLSLGVVGALRAPANAASSVAAVSADGRVVAFRSGATDLIKPPTVPPTAPATDLYVHSGAPGRVRRVYLTVVPGLVATGLYLTYNVSLSADGRILTFRIDAPGTTSGPAVWWFELNDQTGDQGALISADQALGIRADDATGPVMSRDGGTVAFEGLAGRILVWQAEGGLRTLDEWRVTVPAGQAEPASSSFPVLSPDGTRLAFRTAEAVPAAGVTTAGESRLYVRHLATGATWTPLGSVPGASSAVSVQFNPEAAMISFETGATLPGVADLNGAEDVVVATGPEAAFEVVSLATPRETVPVAGNGPSRTATEAISADGRWVLFTSQAENLVGHDGNGRTDVFVRDVVAGTNDLVSVGPNGQAANAGSRALRMTPDGRFVLFASEATDLADGDTNRVTDLYVRDRSARVTYLASARDQANEATAGTKGVGLGVISADGRWVAFESGATDLVPGTTGSGFNVFMRDLVEGRTEWISSNVRLAGSSVSGQSRNPVLSADGQTVAFLAGSPALSQDSFVYTRANQRLVRAGSFQGATEHVLSADGRRLVYAQGGSTPALWVRDHGAGIATRLESTVQNQQYSDLALSADGAWLAYTFRSFLPAPLSSVRSTEVWLRGLDTGETIRVRSGPASAARTDSPAINADGSRVAFRSQAADESAFDTNLQGDVFVWDRPTRVVVMSSRGVVSGRAGEAGSAGPSLSADGRTVAFVSEAQDLAAGDRNGVADVYVAQVPDFLSYDGDRDALPDAWEQQWFRSVAGVPTDDSDRDGANDAAEFVAGTNPMDAGSRLVVQAVGRDASGGLVVTFKSEVGVTYRLEVSSALGGVPFVSVGEAVPGTGGVMTLTLDLDAGAAASFARLTARR